MASSVFYRTSNYLITLLGVFFLTFIGLSSLVLSFFFSSFLSKLAELSCRNNGHLELGSHAHVDPSQPQPQWQLVWPALRGSRSYRRGCLRLSPWPGTLACRQFQNINNWPQATQASPPVLAACLMHRPVMAGNASCNRLCTHLLLAAEQMWRCGCVN